MSDELIEKVAREINAVLEGPINNADFARQQRQWKLAQTLARAAIAVIRTMVIEECEKAARGIRPPVEFQDGVFRLGYLQGKDDAADAIRALAAPRVEQEKKP